MEQANGKQDSAKYSHDKISPEKRRISGPSEPASIKKTFSFKTMLANCHGRRTNPIVPPGSHLYRIALPFLTWLSKPYFNTLKPLIITHTGQDPQQNPPCTEATTVSSTGQHSSSLVDALQNLVVLLHQSLTSASQTPISQKTRSSSLFTNESNG